MIFITCREREELKRASAGKGGGLDRGQRAVSAVVNSGKLFNAPNELLYFLYSVDSRRSMKEKKMRRETARRRQGNLSAARVKRENYPLKPRRKERRRRHNANINASGIVSYVH